MLKFVYQPAILAIVLLFFNGLPIFYNLAYTQDNKPEENFDNNLQKLIEKYLMENPEVILRSIQNLEKRQKKQAAEKAQEILKSKRDFIQNDKFSFVSGNPKGDITLIEFVDYQCGFCKKSHKYIQKIVTEDKNIRLIYKEFPILGSGSIYASRATIAAKKQGKYFELHEALMNAQGRLDENRILQLAQKSGIDTKKLLSDINDDQEIVGDYLGAVSQLAQELQINGTPAFIINNVILRGAVGEKTIKKFIADIRQKQE